MIALSKLSASSSSSPATPIPFRARYVQIEEIGKLRGLAMCSRTACVKSTIACGSRLSSSIAANDGHLWAERFDRDLTVIFAVLDDVTGQHRGRAFAQSHEGDRHRLIEEQTDNMEAFDCFLRGAGSSGGVHAKRAATPGAEDAAAPRRTLTKARPTLLARSRAYHRLVSQRTDQPCVRSIARTGCHPVSRADLQRSRRLLGADLRKSLDATP